MLISYNMEISAQLNGNGFSMKDLLAKTEFDLPKVGEIVTGEIISISKNAVMVDLGALGTGIVYPGEFYDNPNVQKTLKSGQQVSAVLLDVENEEGYRELSLKQAQMTTAWQDIKNKKENGEIITTPVININKGGLIVEVNGVQGFLPLSQLAPEHYPKVDGGDTTKIVQALQKMRNQEINIKILDFSEEENRLIVSERAVSDSQLKEEIAKLKVGDVVDAEITDVTDFGAFAAIAVPGSDNSVAGGSTENQSAQDTSSSDREADGEAVETAKPAAKIEGLIHISEIDWKIIDNPRDILKPGDQVKAKIVSIDGSKVSLSLKALKPDPWIGIDDEYKVGQTAEGIVGKINNYGILVQLDSEISGFVPSIEFGEARPSDLYKIGDGIKVAIVSIDPKEHKMLLTLQKDTPKDDDVKSRGDHVASETKDENGKDKKE